MYNSHGAGSKACSGTNVTANSTSSNAHSRTHKLQAANTLTCVLLISKDAVSDRCDEQIPAPIQANIKKELRI